MRTNWILENLKTSRYPLPNEVGGYDYLINVSDEYILQVHDVCLSKGIKYFWFPTTEFGDMGINSIVGALQILSIAHKEDAKVLVHCHAGANRSRLIKDCYYYIATGEHIVYEKTKLYENLFPGCEDKCERNSLLRNLNLGNLPIQIITLLDSLREKFKKQEHDCAYNTSIDLDSIKIDIGITNINELKN